MRENNLKVEHILRCTETTKATENRKCSGASQLLLTRPAELPNNL